MAQSPMSRRRRDFSEWLCREGQFTPRTSAHRSGSRRFGQCAADARARSEPVVSEEQRSWARLLRGRGREHAQLAGKGWGRDRSPGPSSIQRASSGHRPAGLCDRGELYEVSPITQQMSNYSAGGLPRAWPNALTRGRQSVAAWVRRTHGPGPAGRWRSGAATRPDGARRHRDPQRRRSGVGSGSTSYFSDPARARRPP